MTVFQPSYGTPTDEKVERYATYGMWVVAGLLVLNGLGILRAIRAETRYLEGR